MRDQPASIDDPNLPQDIALRPGATLLLYHIGKALLVDGRPLLALAIVSAIGLHLLELDNSAVTVLVGTGLALLALLRGCSEWRKDLAAYQQVLARQRRRTGLEDLTDPMQRLAARQR